MLIEKLMNHRNTYKPGRASAWPLRPNLTGTSCERFSLPHPSQSSDFPAVRLFPFDGPAPVIKREHPPAVAQLRDRIPSFAFWPVSTAIAEGTGMKTATPRILGRSSYPKEGS